jgi:hypothetical protein
MRTREQSIALRPHRIYYEIMADETKVDSTTEQNATAEIDFDKDLREELARMERAEINRKGYEMRKSKKETTEPEDDENSEDKIADRILARILPTIEKSTTNITLETQLNQMTTDPSLQKLIKHHFENSVAQVGTIQERLENAQAIALKKLIKKQANEINIASSNRAQISNMSMGTNTEPIAQPNQNKLSEAQINTLKARGWDDAKIKRFVETYERNRLS